MMRIVIAVVLLCAVAVAAVWWDGRADRLRDELNRRDTLERMQDATDPDIDDSDILDWLREFANEAAICEGSLDDRKAHAGALVDDGGPKSQRTGQALLAGLKAGCDE